MDSSGDDPKNQKKTTFPEAILNSGLDGWLWFDLRGFRKSNGIGVREYEEERVRLAAALMDVSTADLVAGWRRAAALERRRRVITRVAVITILLSASTAVAWFAYLRHRSIIDARVSAWALTSREFGTGALNRKLDSLAYAIASVSELPTADGYASLIAAMEPLPVHVRTIPHDEIGRAVDVLGFTDDGNLLLSAGYTSVAQFASVRDGKVLARTRLSGRANTFAQRLGSDALAIGTRRGIDVLTYRINGAGPSPRIVQHLGAGNVRAVVFHPQDRILIAGAYDGRLTRYRFSDDLSHWRAEKDVVAPVSSKLQRVPMRC